MRTRAKSTSLLTGLAAILILLAPIGAPPVYAQDQAAAPPAAEEEAPAPLTLDELKMLVARIALYPDDLVAAVIAASLYPLQIVQAARFLEQKKTRPSLEPSDKWDGSVISLLNYPSIVKMMNDDLEWTEQLGDAAVNQQKDLLVAIQQLRDKAVGQGRAEVERQGAGGQRERQRRHHGRPTRRSSMSRPISRRCSTSPATSRSARRSPIGSLPVLLLSNRALLGRRSSPARPLGAIVDWDDWDAWGGDVDIDVDIGDRMDFDFDKIDIDNIDVNN